MPAASAGDLMLVATRWRGCSPGRDPVSIWESPSLAEVPPTAAGVVVVTCNTYWTVNILTVEVRRESSLPRGGCLPRHGGAGRRAAIDPPGRHSSMVWAHHIVPPCQILRSSDRC